MDEPYEGIADEADRWIFVHFALLVLTPFLAAGVWMLLDGIESIPALVARAFLALWMVFFSAVDAVAGIATGVLTRHANSLAGEDRGGVVAATRNLAITRNTTCPFAGILRKPSDGLEPSAPSLPWNASGNRSQPTATVFRLSEPFPAPSHLPPLATGCDRWAP